LVNVIRQAAKHAAWQKIAGKLSGPRRKKIEINLSRLTTDSLVPGKVLSQGTASKAKIVAFSFSSKAREKIEQAGGKAILIEEEIKSNPNMNGLEVVQ